jgi:hypothetical protein
LARREPAADGRVPRDRHDRLARLITNAATDALTTTIAAEGLRGAVRSILDATIADFRGWTFVILIALGISSR